LLPKSESSGNNSRTDEWFRKGDMLEINLRDGVLISQFMVDPAKQNAFYETSQSNAQRVSYDTTVMLTKKQIQKSFEISK
jgi:hypothetical protein